MSENDVVLYEQHGRVAVITLNRPEARNALNRALLQELHARLDEAEADDGVGAVVLAGNGPAFCAGADLKETSADIQGATFDSRYDRANESLSVHTRLPHYRKPVVAAVDGFALAGGCGLAMSCDVVIAGEGAVFGYPEVVRGLVAAMVMVSLSRIMGRQRALELLLSGRRVEPEEAHQLGMVSRVVPEGTARQAAIEWAAQVAEHPAVALRFTKDLFRRVLDLDYDLALEQARDVNQLMHGTTSARRGTAAFAQTTKERR